MIGDEFKGAPIDKEVIHYLLVKVVLCELCETFDDRDPSVIHQSIEWADVGQGSFCFCPIKQVN